MSNKDILGLPPINPNNYLGLNPASNITEGQALPKGEIREINQDSIRRRVAIDTLASNNEKGLNLILSMDQKAFVAYIRNAQYISQIMVESEGKPHEEYCKAFGERMLQVSAHHTNALIEAGAARIAFEINRPPQLENDSPGLLGFLFR